MKRYLLLMISIIWFGFSWAGGGQQDLVPVKIYIIAHQDVYRLHDLGVVIEELRRDHVETRLTSGKMQELRNLGWLVEAVKPEPVDPKIVSAYHDYNWLTAKLDSVHSNYPAITKKISIGKSVDSLELWAFLVSDNPDSSENEAELRFGATIHGNEPVGTELCIAMIDSLTMFYGSVPEITNLVDSREIWFVPMFNPDGNTANTRYNANGMDLNRNFPVPDGSAGDDGTYSQEPETQSMVAWGNTKRFVLGCMYHGGATVVNYHWDYSSIPSPDNDMIREISLGYARLNDPLYNTLWPNYPDPSTVSDSGVVFGYYWYPVYGSLQDWSYYVNSCIDLTIELDDNKKPAANQLPAFWSDNRQSMLFFINKAGQGIQGLVTDSTTGQPLNYARLDVNGIDRSVYSDTVGDYHRLLMTGTYDFTFSKAGYITKTINGIRINYDSLTTLNVALVKEPIGIEGNPCEIVCQRLKLLKTYPNPLRSKVTMAFQLLQSANCKLRIYNATGQLVKTVLDDAKEPGFYDVIWDGTDDAGRRVAAGVYCFSLVAGEQKTMGKLVKID
jgi:carboxypeptidase D